MTNNLRLGNEMSIVKRPKPVIADALRVVRPDRIPVWKGIPLDLSHAQRPFEYIFKDTNREVSLTGEGLGQLYVCFGAPGTGKSYFMLGLLKQLAAPAWEQPWGGLLLDPKQTLVGEARNVIPKDRLHVIAPNQDRGINLLASHLGPRDLGVALALAAQSAGVSAKDPYWLNELKRLFGAGFALLDLTGRPLTLASLANLFLGTELVGNKRVTPLQRDLERAQPASTDEIHRRRLDRALSELAQFATARSDNVETVRSFISQVLSPFLDPDLDYVSDNANQVSLADLILRDGKWVLLAVPRSALSVSRMISSLAKTLFQRAILERLTLYQDNDRRVFLFVDEYAELASDLPGDGFGDSIFFSQMRQFRVLAVIATQGTPMLENSGVKEAWKTILSNSAGKLFFRVADPDTADLASKLLGEGDLIVNDSGVSNSLEGGSVQKGQKLDRRTVLTSDLFLTGLERGHLVFLGTTDGLSRAEVRYVRVT
ncbi:MAG: type IV secretion system DNA-binding domain-containing protein [Nitrospira sp.]